MSDRYTIRTRPARRHIHCRKRNNGLSANASDRCFIATTKRKYPPVRSLTFATIPRRHAYRSARAGGRIRPRFAPFCSARQSASGAPQRWCRTSPDLPASARHGDHFARRASTASPARAARPTSATSALSAAVSPFWRASRAACICGLNCSRSAFCCAAYFSRTVLRFAFSASLSVIPLKSPRAPCAPIMPCAALACLPFAPCGCVGFCADASVALPNQEHGSGKRVTDIDHGHPQPVRRVNGALCAFTPVDVSRYEVVNHRRRPGRWNFFMNRRTPPR